MLNRVEKDDWQQHLNTLVDTERGGLLFLDFADEESLELRPESILGRNYVSARMARQLVDPAYIVVVPQEVMSAERLSAEAEKNGLTGKPLWVYGSVFPQRLLRRALKIQVHPPLPGDEVPEWFDLEFPKRIRAITLPGYSCFTREKLVEAAELLLAEYPKARLKNPIGTSGEGQVVIDSLEALRRFLSRKVDEHKTVRAFDKYLCKTGYIIEANMTDVEAWSFTLTSMPNYKFTSIGRQVEVRTRHPNGTLVKEYAGTSAVTVRGGQERIDDVGLPEAIPVEDPLRVGDDQIVIKADPGILRAAETYLSAMETWADEGIHTTRANVDILKGTLVHRDGSKEVVTTASEDSWRAGGSSPAELLSAVELAASSDRRYALHSTRHVFEPEQSEIYKRYFETLDKAIIFWEGIDESWHDRYLMLCLY